MSQTRNAACSRRSLVIVLSASLFVSGCTQFKKAMVRLGFWDAEVSGVCTYIAPFQVFYDDADMKPKKNDIRAFRKSMYQTVEDTLNREAPSASQMVWIQRTLRSPWPNICDLEKVGEQLIVKQHMSTKKGKHVGYKRCITEWAKAYGASSEGQCPFGGVSYALGTRVDLYESEQCAFEVFVQRVDKGTGPIPEELVVDGPAGSDAPACIVGQMGRDDWSTAGHAAGVAFAKQLKSEYQAILRRAQESE